MVGQPEMNLDQAIVVALANGWIGQEDATALMQAVWNQQDETSLPDSLHLAATTVALVQMKAVPGLH
jgi:hypothetical protein